MLGKQKLPTVEGTETHTTNGWFWALNCLMQYKFAQHKL